MQVSVRWQLLCACCLLCGCSHSEPGFDRSARSASAPDDELAMAADEEFEVSGSAQAQIVLAAYHEDSVQSQLPGTPRGSQISLVDRAGRRYLGTVQTTGPKSVVLMNCIVRETVPAPRGQQQCKTSHVPFETIDIATVAHFLLVAPPDSDSAAQTTQYEAEDVTVDAIVYKSGRRQAWGRPIEHGEPAGLEPPAR